MIHIHLEVERMGLFVVDLDGHELDVVVVSVDPEHLNENLDRYEHRHGNEKGGDESD